MAYCVSFSYTFTVSNQRNARTGALKLHFRGTYVFLLDSPLPGMVWLFRLRPVCEENPGLKSETWATHSMLVRAVHLLVAVKRRFAMHPRFGLCSARHRR
jgi:hypothetical protein